MVMSPVYQVWPKPSCKAQRKVEEDKADRGRGGKWTGLQLAKSLKAVENRGKMEEIGCEINCGAPTTLADKGYMIMLMMIMT